MRNGLAAQADQRKRFRATFERLGKKTNFKGRTEETILLKSVIDLESNRVVADHLWFAYTKGFQQIGLAPGLRVEFEARIKAYSKGYVNKRYKINQRTVDYKLSHPTKIKVVVEG